MSITTKNIYQRLSDIMKSVGKVKKSGYNKFQNYNYVKHDDVIEALRDVIIENGVFLETTISEKSQEIGKTTSTDNNGKIQEKTSIFTNITIETAFVNIDDPKDRFIVRYPGTAIDTQEKGCGKAITSAYKTMLLKAFILESSDDIEENNVEFNGIQSYQKQNVERKLPPPPPKIDESQLKHLLQVAEKERLDNFLKSQSLESVKDISVSQYNTIIDKLRIESIEKRVA